MLHGAPLLAISRSRTALHIDACYSCVLGVLWQLFVVGNWEFRDDVPGVQEAGDVAEHAEEDVDDGVGGADATLDPDGQGGEEDGDDAKEDVSRGAHIWDLDDLLNRF
jgi:hypothetical protein